jgi:hypothetical protein
MFYVGELGNIHQSCSFNCTISFLRNTFRKAAGTYVNVTLLYFCRNVVTFMENGIKNVFHYLFSTSFCHLSFMGL